MILIVGIVGGLIVLALGVMVFSLIIAALAAEGETMVNRVYHLDRGFEHLEQKLAGCGAIVERIANEVQARGVEHDAGIAKISLVGAGMKTSPGIAAKMFRVLADENINIQMISTSTIRISVVTAAADLEAAARALHTAFGLDSGQAYSAPLPERK